MQQKLAAPIERGCRRLDPGGKRSQTRSPPATNFPSFSSICPEQVVEFSSVFLLAPALVHHLPRFAADRPSSQQIGQRQIVAVVVRRRNRCCCALFEKRHCASRACPIARRTPPGCGWHRNVGLQFERLAKLFARSIGLSRVGQGCRQVGPGHPESGFSRTAASRCSIALASC
jgi:hypothetical protein